MALPSRNLHLRCETCGIEFTMADPDYPHVRPPDRREKDPPCPSCGGQAECAGFDINLPTREAVVERAQQLYQENRAWFESHHPGQFVGVNAAIEKMALGPTADMVHAA